MLKAYDRVLSGSMKFAYFCVEHVGSSNLRSVIGVADEESRRLGEDVVDFAKDVVFVAKPGLGKIEYPRITGDRSVRKGVERQVRRSFRIDGDLGGRSAGGIRTKDAIMGIPRKDGGGSRQAFKLPQPFIIAKEECFIFLDRTANGTAELIAAKRRDVVPVKKIPRVEGAVPDEFVSCSVKLVRARLGDGVNDATGSAAVRGREVVGQNRELEDTVNSQVHAQRASRATVRVVIDDQSIDQKGILRRPGTGNGNLETVAARLAASIGIILTSTENSAGLQ